MDQREIRCILEICQEVDWLVTQDTGAADLEVLERTRLKMNDYLMAREWRKAEQTAYDILLYHSGQESQAQLLMAEAGR